MVTAVRSETQQTTTVPRFWLLQVQVRNLLCRTTDISQNTLDKIAGKGLTNQWIEKLGVYGFDTGNRSHVGLELTIDWATYTMHVLVFGDEVSIDKTVYEDNLAPEVGNGIKVFNQAVIEECLRTECRVFYCKGVDRERANRELGLQPALPLKWAGKVDQQAFAVAEVPELTVVFKQAIPEESLPDDAGNEKGLFDRIKDAFG